MRFAPAAMRCAVLLIATVVPAHARLLSPATDASHGKLAGVSSVRKLGLDRGRLAKLRMKQRARLREFPIGDVRTGDLVLQRFEPFAPDARAEIMEAGGPRRLALPDNVYFRGTVAGDPTSLALVVAGRRRVHGFVVADGEVFPFGPGGAGSHRAYALRNADPHRHAPPRDFCANDLHPEAVAIPEDELARIAALPATAAAPATLKQADVAIETDRELRTRFSTDGAALDYLASLAAAATAIYERDVAVRLRFSYIRLWGASPADPYSATDPSGTLGELRSYWNNAANNMAQIAGPRTVVHMISGKSVQGGVAYVNALCSQNFGYGVSQVRGTFDLSNPSSVWDVVVVTHELGHNFGSSHTHCYSPPVDRCYNGESGCYSGSVVASRGTIMSYCHLLGGGLSNIDLLFGATVSARIGERVAAASCLATVPGGSTTTTSSSTTTTTTSTSTTTRPTTTSTTRPPTTTTSTTTSTSTTKPTTTTTSTTRPPTTTTSSSTTSTLRPTTSRPPTTTSTSTSTRPTTTSTTTSTRPTTTSTTTSTRPPTSSTATPTTTTSSTTLPGDVDGDGVATGDVCPGTPAGDLVDPRGCTLCPCAAPSHTAYVRCVRDSIDLSAAAATAAGRRAVLQQAKRSSCGHPNATRCCVYRGATESKGRCRMLTRDDCGARASALRAVDRGPGSCSAIRCTR